ncbi:MAG: hypothetical protein PVH56_06080, partial [Desulfobacterales bacterium]
NRDRLDVADGKLNQFSANVWLSFPFTVLFIGTLIHEFARVSLTIIQVAVISKKLPHPSISFHPERSFFPN